MGKRLALAAAIALAIAAAGMLISRALFEEGEERAAKSPPDAATAKEVPPDAAAEELLPVEIVRVSGEVERRGDGGDWIAVEAGAELDPEDVIRTGADGRASLNVGGVQVELDHGSQISVPGISATVSRVVLGAGRLSARVPSGRDEAFGVEVEGGAVAESSEGEFAVLKGRGGEVTVAALEGQARLTSRERTVELEEGEQSVAEPGAAPSEPQEIPPSLFLKVRRPGKSTREKKITVSGETTAGAVLEVNGVLVEVDAEGRFATVIGLEEGRNRIRLNSRDVVGREESSDLRVNLDTHTPEVGGQVKWGGEE